MTPDQAVTLSANDSYVRPGPTVAASLLVISKSDGRSAHHKSASKLAATRRGSVLVLVVALLVLLALVGTAYLTTTRFDRAAGVQHVTNTQIDLLVDGVRRITEGTISGDLFDGSGTLGFRRNGFLGDTAVGGSIFRTTPWTAPVLIPVSNPTAPNISFPYVSLSANSNIDSIATPDFAPIAPNLTQGDQWLASRTPAALTPGAANAVNNPPFWRAITAPLTGDRFEAFITAGAVTGNGTSTIGASFTQRVNVVPDSIDLVLPSGSTLTVPAFQFLQSDLAAAAPPYGTQTTVPTSTGTASRVIAADADGDGVADAGLVKLVQVGDVTYYYAVRIIDQNSAVNVNTAFTRSVDVFGAGNVSNVFGHQGLFPSGVGLAELLRSANPNYLVVAGPDGITAANATWNQTSSDPANGEIVLLHNTRMGAAPANVEMSGVAGFGSAGPATSNPNPFADNNATRTDFRFISQGDGLWNVLGRRLEFPGKFANGITGTPYGIGDTAALAYGFSILPADSSPTQIELDLAASLVDGLGGKGRGVLATKPYNPSLRNAQGPANWYNLNFNFESEIAAAPVPTNWMFRRSMFTTWNPTANLSPITAFTLNTTGADAGTPVTANTFMIPYPAATPKAAINKAPFGELWRAYWNVMSGGFDNAGNALGPINNSTAAEPPADVYKGNYFGPAGAATNKDLQTVSDPAGGAVQGPADFTRFAGTGTIDNSHPQRMFRSSLRDTNVVVSGTAIQLTPAQMVVLRSSLAAVNTLAMRRPQIFNSTAEFTKQSMGRDLDEIPTIDYVIPDTGGNYDVRIYGFRPQPFITEVYANTDTASEGQSNPSGYVAIELYNPYPFPIRLDTDPLQAGAEALVPLATINGGWKIVALDRTGGSAERTPQPQFVVDFAAAAGGTTWWPQTAGAGAVVPPRGYLLIENYSADGATVPAPRASARPASSRLPPIGAIPARNSGDAPLNVVYVHELRLDDPVANPSSTGNRELVLMRPVDQTQSGAGLTTRDVAESFVPVDSFDFTGLQVGGILISPPDPPTAQTTPRTWSYKRQSVQSTGAFTGILAGSPSWTFVHPGFYDGRRPTRRHQGTRESIWTGVGDQDPFRSDLGMSGTPLVPDPPPTLGYNLASGAGAVESNDNAAASYANPMFPIQLCAPGMVGWLPRSVRHIPDGSTLDPLKTYRAGELVRVGNLAYRYVGTPTAPPLPPVGNRDFWEPVLEFDAATRAAPFQGFARNADMLQVPFIGAYRIMRNGVLVEVNSITMDAAMADDTDPQNDVNGAPGSATYSGISDYPPAEPPVPALTYGYASREQLGRFCPLRPTASTGPDYNADDLTFVSGASGAVQPNADLAYSDTSPDRSKWRYAFAKRLFDFLSVYDPQDDYLPNAHPYTYTPPPGGLNPVPVSNTGATPGITTSDPPPPLNTALYSENTAPIHGLINVNTASWRVLSAVPWIPTEATVAPLGGGFMHDQFTWTPPVGGTPGAFTAGANTIDDNIDLAQAIVYFRDGDPARQILPQGPFTSLFDLYRVKAFRDVQHYLINSGARSRDMSELTDGASTQIPPPAQQRLAGDGVRYDFEEQYLLLNRVSNILTTRSDAFTAYILLQGWRGVGTASPELVAQRRMTYLIDRTQVTGKPTSGVRTIQGTAPKN